MFEDALERDLYNYEREQERLDKDRDDFDRNHSYSKFFKHKDWINQYIEDEVEELNDDLYLGDISESDYEDIVDELVELNVVLHTKDYASIEELNDDVLNIISEIRYDGYRDYEEEIKAWDSKYNL